MSSTCYYKSIVLEAGLDYKRITTAMDINSYTNTYVIKIHCSRCNGFLYKYRKRSNGALIKCHADRIIEDSTRGDLKCPKCGQEFARHKMISNKPAQKIIRGRVYVKGHLKR